MDIGKLLHVEITQEMKKAYLDYAMSVIVARALPDVRDGLKPVHRRILYGMHAMGVIHSSKYTKSAKIVGEVMGKFHPHGDMPIYDALVRLAQNFSVRYPLIDGQGNFGCFTKDTKVKLIDGRSLSFEELTKEHSEGRRHWGYTFNTELKKIEVAEIKDPRVTRKNAELVEIILDNNYTIRCTPDHRFLLRNGTYKEARDLTSEMSLMPLYTKPYDGVNNKKLKDYEIVFQPLLEMWDFVHHLADVWNLQENIYEKPQGRIRHHIDFNKHNNNPDNIVRLGWKEHWQRHYTMVSWRHKNDPEYVKKLAVGRKKFLDSHHEILSQRATIRNKKLWENPIHRKKLTEHMKIKWQDEAYKKTMAEIASKNLKALWKTADFQKLLSELKSKDMKRRWQDPEYRSHMQKQMQEMSIKLWSNPMHREYISKIMKEKAQDPVWRDERSIIAKSLWKDPSYREKFSPTHFSDIASLLWSNEEMRILQSKKSKLLWENTTFKNKIVQSVRIANKRRLQENPEMMKELTQRAKIALHNKWQDPEYKKKVVKSKILRFVSKIAKGNPELTPDLYESQRKNNGVPRIENALQYFDDFSHMVQAARTYNHKVKSVRLLQEHEDTYDLTIGPWHNFALDAGVFVHNSVDGDPPAHMRYTEARMAAITAEMLFDINKETVDFIPNFDSTEEEPVYLPARLPNLLLMGSEGIAVGMATKIPPHNLGEVIDAIIAMINKTSITKEPKITLATDITIEELLMHIKGPDFPTAGIIYDAVEIKNMYTTGKGKILMRGKADIEDIGNGKSAIIITELPYQVNKALLVARIAELAKEKKVEGITDLRDESDRHGMRVVVELKRDATPKKVLNNLFKHTSLQTVFAANVVALVEGTPQTLNLKTILSEYLKHRFIVITKRSEFELRQAKARLHILEGLKIAVDHIDAVIKTIRESKDQETAKQNLMEKFKLSEIQTVAILDMQLRRLAALERQKIEDELLMVQETINYLEDLLTHSDKILSVVKEELVQLKEKYADARRTKVFKGKVDEFSEEDLIPNEATVITITNTGYIKRQSMNSFRTQNRGGKGVRGMTTKDEDGILHIRYAQTHDNILFFTNKGKVFQLRAYEIAESQRTSKGTAIVNLLNVEQGEKVESFISYSKEEKGKYIFLSTRKGTVKKSALTEFENIRRSGIVAIKLDAGDELVWSKFTNGDDDVLLTTFEGKAIRFSEKSIRPLGRATTGVRGIKISVSDHVISMDVIDKENTKSTLLTIMENGLGKKTPTGAFRGQSRGGLGVKVANVTPKTGKVVFAQVVPDNCQAVIITSKRGQVVKLEMKSIPTLSRATQGVILMRFSNAHDSVTSATCIEEDEA